MWSLTNTNGYVIATRSDFPSIQSILKRLNYSTTTVGSDFVYGSRWPVISNLTRNLMGHLTYTEPSATVYPTPPST